MKRKLLFAAMLAIAGAFTFNVHAQTDVTASYIGDLNQYVNGGWEGSCGNNHAESAGNGWWNTQHNLTGGHSFRNLESWCPNVGSAGVMIGRTMVLPAGNYTLSFEAYGATTNNATDKTVPAAGDIKAFFSGSDTKYDVTNTVLDDATYHPVSFTFNVTADNTAYTFGVEKMSDESRANWARIQNVQLVLNSTNITPIVNNDIAGWTYSGSQTWHTNTWSTEGQRDGTRFQVPFHELWVSSGGILADATIKQSYTPTQTGVYKVTAWVRALNESGGAVSGAKIFVGDTEADACGGTAITNGTLGTFSALADGVAGTPFEYGFELENATINWLSFKNVTITYLGSLPQEEVDALLAQVPTGKMAASIQTELNSRVSALETTASVANYNALASYIATANASVTDYANLATAITNAQNFTVYKPVFPASQTAYNAAITAAQTVYDDATAATCTATIASLTTAAQNAYVSDYTIFTNDYSYSYATLLNEDMREWSTTNWGMRDGDQHWNGQNPYPYYEQSASWGTVEWSQSATETVTLPAGNYVMSIIARASAFTNSTMSVTIGGTTTTTNLTKKGDVGLGVTTDGEASFDTSKTYANSNNGRGWEYRFVAFTVDEDNTDVTINVSASTDRQYNWVSLTNPLLKGSVSPNQVILNQINTLLTTLTGYESQIHASTYGTFSADIAAAEAATVDNTEAELEAIVTSLQADIVTASALLANMTTIADNKGDITSLINGTFDSNADGWVDGNRVTGLARSWRSGTENNAFLERTANGTMKCTLANMPAGTYKVVAASRAAAGCTVTPQIAGTPGAALTGVGDTQSVESEINLNGVQMPYSSLGGFTTNGNGHNWQWITATGTLAADGNLVIEFICNADGKTGNDSWMAIDDVHLYCTNLDGTSYTVTAPVISGNTYVSTVNSGSSNREVLTCDIVFSNPNAILRTNSQVRTASGELLNNNKYSKTDINKLVLYDGYPYSDYTDDTFLRINNGATLYRNIPAGTWCTLVVPFNPNNLDEKLIPTELSSEGVLSFGNAGATGLNNKPMLVKSTAGVTAITGVRANSSDGVAYGDMTSGTGAPMQGTYSAISAVPEGSYVVARVEDADALYKVDGPVSLGTFRAYFTVSADAPAKIRLNLDGDATGIEELMQEAPAMTKDAVIYDLSGRRVQNATKGLYIVNGKKVFIK